ncbi:MAG TPA: metallophosphoesterase [Saprospiraceae bacterium]|nr:metallophosphoesterase [Saprospiraceae bacterium]
MTNILLLSDTHGYIDDQMIKYVMQADEVWHAGDIGDIKVTDTIARLKPLRAVYGNIDGTAARAQFSLDENFLIENTRVLMTHIGGYPGRYDRRVKETLKQNPPNLFISGHSHILKIIYDKKLDLLHLNPGAAGKSGFHKVRSMLRFGIDNSGIKNMEIIELEKRS